VRNRALIAVMWRCGLRIAEALALRPADIDLGGDVLSVRHGKGDKARKLGIDATTSALLARWMDTSANLKLNRRGGMLFCTLRGGEIDQSYVRHLHRREVATLGLLELSLVSDVRANVRCERPMRGARRFIRARGPSRLILGQVVRGTVS
jgi:site-specific recombinase XerC